MFAQTRALILIAIALLTAFSNVASDNFQGEYMVVAPLPDGDSLNEREAPSAGAKIIDRLMPGTLVAVGEHKVTEGKSWRQKAGDGGGWLDESFLKPADFRLIGDTSVPAAGTCSGFEPIWSLDWDEKRLTLELGDEIQQYPITQIIKAKGYREALLVAASKPNYQITLRFEAAPCPYLPVDAFMFGRGTLTIENKDQFAWYLGCCSPTASALNPEEESEAVSAVTEGSNGPTSTEDFLAGKYALQIASRTSDQEVASLFETVSERLQDASDAHGLEIFQAQNGWYAIVVLTPSKIACNATRETLVARALIPSDSYCNSGDRYIRRIRIKDGIFFPVYDENNTAKTNSKKQAIADLDKSSKPEVVSPVRQHHLEFSREKLMRASFGIEIGQHISSILSVFELLATEPSSSNDLTMYEFAAPPYNWVGKTDGSLSVITKGERVILYIIGYLDQSRSQDLTKILSSHYGEPSIDYFGGAAIGIAGLTYSWLTDTTRHNITVTSGTNMKGEPIQGFRYSASEWP